MTKHKLAVAQYDNEVILFKNVKGKDIEIENFKSLKRLLKVLEQKL
jgi:hypothetical protein